MKIIEEICISLLISFIRTFIITFLGEIKIHICYKIYLLGEYIICPEETMAIYVFMEEEVDNYIDAKLNRNSPTK
jgi:hypothetical protein